MVVMPCAAMGLTEWSGNQTGGKHPQISKRNLRPQDMDIYPTLRPQFDHHL
jgi:hypothetical protein